MFPLCVFSNHNHNLPHLLKALNVSLICPKPKFGFILQNTRQPPSALIYLCKYILLSKLSSTYAKNLQILRGRPAVHLHTCRCRCHNDAAKLNKTIFKQNCQTLVLLEINSTISLAFMLPCAAFHLLSPPPPSISCCCFSSWTFITAP